MANETKPYPRIIIGMPLERTIPQCGFWSALQLAQQGYPFVKLEYSRVDVARNMFARHLLDSDFTHILMLDADHQHPPDIAVKLGRWVIDDPSRLVISAYVQRRGEPFDPCVFFPNGDGGMFSPVDMPEGLVQVRNEHGPGWLGSGAILIAREVFERIPWPWFAYEYIQGKYPTEDVYFSRKCNEYGVELWIDTTVESPHQLETYITKATLHSYLAAHPEQITAATPQEASYENGSKEAP